MIITDFINNYGESFSHISLNCEKLRIKLLQILIATLLVSVAIIVLLYQKTDIKESVFFLTIIILLVINLLEFIFFNSYLQSTFNEECVPFILKSLGNVESKNNEQLLSNKPLISDIVINSSNLIPLYMSRIDTEAYYGKHNGTNFFILNSCMFGSKKRTQFEGITLLLNLTKDTNSNIRIQTKYQNNIPPRCYLVLILIMPFIIFIPLIPLFILFWNKHFNPISKNLKKVGLEQTQINKNYNIYTLLPDKESVFYNDEFIKYFNAIHSAFGIKSAKMQIYGKRIFIIMPTTKNIMYNASLFRPIRLNNLTKIIEKYISIYNFIDYVKEIS